MMDEGASQEDACAKIHMIDINGLVTKKRAESMTERHRLFAKVCCLHLFHVIKEKLKAEVDAAGRRPQRALQ